jgi:hypothetical protein
MKKLGKIVVVLLAFSLGLTGAVNAVSWSPLEEERGEQAAKGIMKKGATVCLFQSGTPDVKKAISPGDILAVYRETGSRKLTKVGKIKVLFYEGVDYLKGEVVEGEIKAGDIAKKGDVASLIISSENNCK